MESKLPIFSTYLLDASGVLYNESGVISGVPRVVSRLQACANVFLVTNNSCNSPSTISSQLSSVGYSIPPENIFSSGYGLSEDDSIRTMLSGKRVFWIGPMDTRYYLSPVDGAVIVDTLEQAQVVVMSTSVGMESDLYYIDLAEKLLQNPKPIVCCNPDLWVRGEGRTLIPVTGYYASLFEKRGLPVFWIGKPLENFSRLVEQRLRYLGIPLGQGVCFFDDNPKNVEAIQAHLGILGCWVRDCGIAFDVDPDTVNTSFWIGSLADI